MAFAKTIAAAVMAGLLLGAIPVSAAPNDVASKNLKAVMRALKASKIKYTTETEPCATEMSCTVMVGHTQINTYGGGAVDVKTSSMVPNTSYAVICAATLSGITNVDFDTASSFVGEALAKGRLKIGGVLLKVGADSDGKLSCDIWKKPT